MRHVKKASRGWFKQPKKTVQALQRHATKRLEERFDFDDTDHARASIRKLIQAGKSILMCRKSRRVSCHLVRYEGVEVVAFYDGIRNEVVTVLSLQCREYKDWVDQLILMSPVTKTKSICKGAA
jgi:predicted MarR family transcription regulator